MVLTFSDRTFAIYTVNAYQILGLLNKITECPWFIYKLVFEKGVLCANSRNEYQITRCIEIMTTKNFKIGLGKYIIRSNSITYINENYEDLIKQTKYFVGVCPEFPGVNHSQLVWKIITKVEFDKLKSKYNLTNKKS